MSAATADPALTQAIDDFWAARNGDPFPLHWEPQLTQDDAYRINLALTDRHAAQGEPQAGWKVGLTARAIREQFGLPEPLFAVLFEKGRWESGRTWAKGGWFVHHPAVQEGDCRLIPDVAPIFECRLDLVDGGEVGNCSGVYMAPLWVSPL